MTTIAGRLDALNGRPKDYTSMDIRTPEYPQIFDFMIISLFVVDHTQICGGITAEAFLPPRVGSVDHTQICGQSQPSGQKP